MLFFEWIIDKNILIVPTERKILVKYLPFMDVPDNGCYDKYHDNNDQHRSYCSSCSLVAPSFVWNCTWLWNNGRMSTRWTGVFSSIFEPILQEIILVPLYCGYNAVLIQEARYNIIWSFLWSKNGKNNR